VIKNWLKEQISQTNPLRLLYHKLVSASIATKHGFPAKDFVCIGITGTDGKTSACHMLTSILEAAGKNTACLSTQKIQIGDKIKRNCSHMTTLGRDKLQELLKKMKEGGVSHAVIECSSQALTQSRLYGIPFEVVALTNISHEHLDYHGTFENYRKEKGKLFKNCKQTHVLNLDQEETEFFLNYKSKNKFLIGRDIKASNINTSSRGSSFTLHIDNKETPVTLNIPGRFNIDNALTATACAHALNISISDIKQGLESLTKIPGRTEEINIGQVFKVFLDFAVTPKALETIYKDLKEVTKGKIIGVFGCTGNRDKEKRIPMGKIAARLADTIILTTDEPYHENIEDIAATVELGIKSESKEDFTYIKELDRLKAIRKAFEIAKEGDTVIITGMGDFDSRVIGKNQTIDWDERQIITEELKNLSQQN